MRWSHLEVVLLGGLFVACGVEVTPLGAVIGPATEDDGGVDVGSDAGSDVADDATSASDGPSAPGTWTTMSLPPQYMHFKGAWLASPSEPWVLGIDRTPVTSGPIDGGPLDATSGSDGGVVSYNGGVLRLVGGTWTTFDLPFVADALWGDVPGHAWVVGSNIITETNGSLVTSNYVPPIWCNLHAIWGFDASHVWAAGTSMLTWDGASWTQAPLVGSFDDVTAMWGSSASDVWAVSEAAVLRHWDGAAWTATSTAITSSLRGVWGSRHDDVWVVGDAGTVLHWNGASWSPVPGGGTVDLLAVWGSGPDDVWIVGRAGTILHASKGIVRALDAPTSSDLGAVVGTSERSAWALGDDVLLHFQK